uniref:Uncharacterized protein n=1 Tax=Podoviridae sp. ctZkC8 TaxID=2825259 RepID=A0A8S5UC84_9CAUD|nr:MAG TPA: hypothetical protein [Podoviridae sp. ctZkC8]
MESQLPMPSVSYAALITLSSNSFPNMFLNSFFLNNIFPLL